MNADSIKIESDEDGFHLVLQLDQEIPMVTNEGRLDVRIHNCAEALHEQVNLIIGGWLAEARSAATMPADSGRLTDAGYENPRFYDTPGSAYDTSDPKHPDFHSVHADLWDAREGK